MIYLLFWIKSDLLNFIIYGKVINDNRNLVLFLLYNRDIYILGL